MAKSEHSIKLVAETVLKYIGLSGWVSISDLVQFAAEQAISQELLHRCIRLLDRTRAITQRSGPEGAAGWESLLGTSASSKRYGALSEWMPVGMKLRTPVLGQLQGKQDNEFCLQEDGAGALIFTPAQARAMLRKAYRLSGLGAVTGLSEASLHRVAIRYLSTEEVGRAVYVRRPVNIHRQAVGECRHEGLMPGSCIRWHMAFPVTHFTPDVIDRLLAVAQDVGFSPAGSGHAGGHWGLFTLDRGA